MKREIKIYDTNLKVGLISYEKLHNDILKQDNLLDIKKIINRFIIDNIIEDRVFYQGITINEGFCYVITNKINNRK